MCVCASEKAGDRGKGTYRPKKSMDMPLMEKETPKMLLAIQC